MTHMNGQILKLNSRDFFFCGNRTNFPDFLRLLLYLPLLICHTGHGPLIYPLTANVSEHLSDQLQKRQIPDFSHFYKFF